MSKKQKRSKNHQKNNITKGIFTVLEQDSNKPFTYKDIAEKLQILDATSRNILIKKLVSLKEQKRISEPTRGYYQAITNDKTKQYHEGTVDITGKGNAYIIIDGFEEDVFIPFNKINKAFHRDTVQVYVYPRRKGKKLEGEIISITHRFKTTLSPCLASLMPCCDIKKSVYILKSAILTKANRSCISITPTKVVVELTKWEQNSSSPEGKITQVLGVPGEHQTEIHAILAAYGLPYEFPFEVSEFANQIDTSIQDSEIAKRRDMRDVLTFTIDPKDAKDFDDALSFQKLDNGHFEIGIHIADVSHYLQEGTVLDDEAFQRATSVYLVDRVVPMLPEVLSNEACSSKPFRNYLCLRVYFKNSRESIFFFMRS